MRKTLLAATAMALIGGSSIARADLIAVTGVAGGSVFGSFNGSDQTIGWTFSTATDITVTELGFFDQTPADPLSQTHEVGIWDASGTLLASITVGTNDPLDGSFRYHTITPFDLVSGITYFIGAAITSPFSEPASRHPQISRYSLPRAMPVVEALAIPRP
jgi:hypothetical protein